ncbi:hypothetical protein [uncultured Paracoccus sp.]|uniref:hypothetical protein n=1 Tax=uncultured Paracoccus sp. TaxID=189685 RepID=UPI0025CD082D|nr:hypothetical protein [uncultured Paracoccus sp.]
MTDRITVEGFVIVPPLSPWDEKHRDEIWGYIPPNTFGRTEAEAWRRNAGAASRDPGEFAILVQRWHDRGYRVKRATMVIEP